MLGINASTICYYTSDFWQEFGDRRFKHMPLFTSGPMSVLILITAYLLTVLKIIPHFMSQREPFVLRKVIQCYNIFLVSLNAFFFIYELISLDYGRKLLQLEIPSDDEITPELQIELILYYIYFWSKIIDFMDTIFFALRKKNSQVTFLHLYHHSLMVGLAWVGLWYRFNMKPNKLFILCNSFVHTIMYSYYALAALGPKVQHYLWWKRYLTQLQLVQFVIFMTYGVITEMNGIPYPEVLRVGVQAQSPFFFYLFFDFYMTRYKSAGEKLK